MPNVPLIDFGSGTFAPAYLGAADLPWLQALLDEVELLAGKPRAALEARLKEPLPVEVAMWKVRVAGRILLGFAAKTDKPAIPPREVRKVVFAEAVRGGSRMDVITRAASMLDITSELVESSIYADLPSRRPVPSLSGAIGPEELARRVNLSLVQGLVARTRLMRIHAVGGARDLVRHAKREGLLCTVRPGAEPDACILEVSGPLALFRQTALYARALAGLIPRLAWCQRYWVEARCETERGPRTVVVRSGDPIAPSQEPVRFDSRVEECFARDFARAAPDWDVLREPEPVMLDGTLVFPDFALVSRFDPGDRWLIEIVGFWTPGYLVQKLERLRAMEMRRLIVCINRDRACAEEDLPTGARIIRFRKKIDPQEVMAAMTMPEDEA